MVRQRVVSTWATCAGEPARRAVSSVRWKRFFGKKSHVFGEEAEDATHQEPGNALRRMATILERGGELGQLARDLAGHLLRLAARAAGRAQQHQGDRLARHHLEDFLRLLPGERRIGGEQPRRVSQGELERVGRRRRVGHSGSLWLLLQRVSGDALECQRHGLADADAHREQGASRRSRL